MLVEPGAFTVLCFGDSNTYGYRADRDGRWPADVRWTGQLQNVLGRRYRIIEEGLGGRTTDLDDPGDAGCNGDHSAGYNGRTYLRPCLSSHSPLDMVVIMLGTNDLKTRFNRSAGDIAAALGRLVDDVAALGYNSANRSPAILLLSPIHIDDRASLFAERGPDYDDNSVRKSRELGGEIAKLAAVRGVSFADAASVTRAGDDGTHLDLDSHKPLAELVAREVLRVSWAGGSRPSVAAEPEVRAPADEAFPEGSFPAATDPAEKGPSYGRATQSEPPGHG